MQLSVPAPVSAGPEVAATAPAADLGPLAWVNDEIRKSLDAAAKALRRQVRDAASDAGALRLAQHQLHQAAGALSMVGQPAPARVVEAMEAVVRNLAIEPQRCGEEVVSKVERTGFAVTEFLQALLAGRAASAVALFPQYRELLEFVGHDRIHPADLWSLDWRWVDVSAPWAQPALAYDPSVRSTFDREVLRVVKDGDAVAARRLHDVCLGLAYGASTHHAVGFWTLAAGFFEASSLGLLAGDVYAKRSASRVLLQYATLARAGDAEVSEALARDLLFQCAQAFPGMRSDAATLRAVRRAWGIDGARPLDYTSVQFGRFDPLVLAQARKRIEAAKETWAALSSGDVSRVRLAVDTFTQLGESLQKLQGASVPLVQALAQAVEASMRSGQSPGTELALEVATALLYLEAACGELDPHERQFAERARQLAGRIERARHEGRSEPLEPWMEELYRRVSDRQTLGTVIGELRGQLGGLEKSLDQYFRRPADSGLLQAVPAQLLQMRGVFSVLGLEQAAQTLLHMHGRIDHLLARGGSGDAAQDFEALGSNLGALGFLIDMLGYQPALARRLFVFDPQAGVLKPLMGRQAAGMEEGGAAAAPESAIEPAEADGTPPSGAAADAELAARLAQLDAQDAPPLSPIEDFGRAAENWNAKDFAAAAAAPPPGALPDTEVTEFEDDDLQAIFLAEAREVVANGRAAVEALRERAADMGQQTVLRRAFHTLKGSARMVGLAEFGNAAWALEQLLNTWLADQRPADADLLSVAGDALENFARWGEAIAAGAAPGWTGTPFWEAADVLRQGGHLPAPTPVQATDVGIRTEDDAASAKALPSAPVEFGPRALPSLPDLADLSDPSFAATDFDALPHAGRAVDPFAPLADEQAGARGRGSEVGAGNPDHDAFAATDFLDFGAFPASGDSGSPDPAGTPAGAESFDFLATTNGSAASTAVAAVPVDFPALADEGTPQAAAATTESATATDAAPAAPDGPVEVGAWVAAPGEAEAIDLPQAALSTVSEAQPALQPGAEAPADHDLPREEGAAAALPEATTAAQQTPATPATTEPAAPTAQAQDAAAAPAFAEIDDSVKAIGPLRIGLALYNVYLGEADEWSRRLADEVGAWALKPQAGVPDSAVALAHSLAGSSATVGFQGLSGMARLFEAALQQLQMPGRGTDAQGTVLVAAAGEVRGLLQQFAAGSLTAPEPRTLQALREIAAMPTPPAPPAPPAGSTPATGRSAVRGLASMFSRGGSGKGAKSDAADEDFVASAAAHDADPPPVETPAAAIAASAIAARALPDEGATDAGQEALDEESDAIDQVDAVDAELFAIFEEEAVELLPQLGAALRAWAQQPQAPAPRASTLRTLHTLKGSARLAGAMRLGERAHRMETEIERMGTEAVAREAVERLLGRFDVLQTAFDDLRQAGAAQPAADAPVAPEADAPAAGAPPSAVAADADADAVPAAGAGLAGTQAALAADAAPTGGLAVPSPSMLAPLRAAAGQAIRIRTQLLDRLVAQSGEVIITRSRLEGEIGQLRGSLDDLTGNLDRLRQQLRDIELQAESQMQSRLAQAKDSQQGFDPLEFDRFTRVQELTRMMAESVNDVATVQRTLQKTVQATEDDLALQARQTRELQRGLLRTRMVEFESLSERLYRVVRQASKETAKPVRLDIVGGRVEMDRGVLERMAPAFEHLLRNCVAHGIEEPAARAQAGKDPIGLITIELHQEGNDVAISFRDDGNGLDVARIGERARALGLLAQDQALSAEEAAEMIFRPGFSTARQVSELAGRGIGTDVVRAQVAALGGRIETHSAPGQGVAFKLVLPLTTAVTHVVMMRAGAVSFGVPSNLIELVQRAGAAELADAYASRSHRFAGEDLPFYWAGALLQSSARSERPPGKSNTVVIVRSAAQRLALHVDEVLGNQEAVIKNLGPQLARLPGMAGITVLASGAVVLLYNPVALAAVHGEQARQLSHLDGGVADAAAAATPAAPMPALPPEAPAAPLVLVVDDSITVRRVTQRLLQREGFRVALAADGLQALERLQQERPAVVLSDIEMPRMDGFDLARNIRGDAALADLPIIMITSRIAEKHRDHAGQLGVNHYLGKPYSEEELLRLVRGYTGVAPQAELLAA